LKWGVIYGREKISKILNRPLSSVALKLKQLGVMKCIRWTEEEDRFIIENYDRMSIKELAAHLGRTQYAVVSHIRMLRNRGIIKHRKRISKDWSEDEEEFLRKHYGIMDTKELAKLLGRSTCAINTKASRMGIRKHWHGNMPKYLIPLMRAAEERSFS